MPSDPRDYHLDLGSTDGAARTPEPASAAPHRRPFLSVHFACCGVYQRVYRHKDGDRYEGACPRCGQRVRFAVGEGGTHCRQFRVE